MKNFKDKITDDMNETRRKVSQFNQRRALQIPAENTKMIVVGILVFSVMMFTIIGDKNVKPILWYWVGFMVLLLIGCAIQDFLVSRKIKKL